MAAASMAAATIALQSTSSRAARLRLVVPVALAVATSRGAAADAAQAAAPPFTASQVSGAMLVTLMVDALTLRMLRQDHDMIAIAVRHDIMVALCRAPNSRLLSLEIIGRPARAKGEQ